MKLQKNTENVTWNINKFQTYEPSLMFKGMNSFFSIMSTVEVQGSKPALRYQDGGDYNGAIIYTRDISTPPSDDNLSLNWNVFSAGGNYNMGLNSVYDAVMTFINNLTVSQAFYAKTESSQCYDNTDLPTQMFVWYRSLTSEEAAPLKSKVTTQDLPLSKVQWDIKTFITDDVTKVGNTINGFLNAMSSKDSTCASIAIDEWYASNNLEVFGGISFARGLNNAPNASTLGYNWNYHTSIGSPTDAFSNTSAFLNTLTDAQACYGKLTATAGQELNETIVTFWYSELI